MCPPLAAYAYDAVASLALAFGQSYPSRDSDLVQRQLRSLNVSGASGRLSFESNGDREPSSATYTLENFRVSDDGVVSYPTVMRAKASAGAALTWLDEVYYPSPSVDRNTNMPIDKTTINDHTLRNMTAMMGALLGIVIVYVTWRGVRFLRAAMLAKRELEASDQRRCRAAVRAAVTLQAIGT